ncbi:MAG: DUF4150 domain-containing protein [Anaerolineae bacterium]|jgi:hypothetical protein
MGFPIATKKSGFICFAFPDVCKTQVGPAQVPIPYPNLGQLSDATNVSDGEGEVLAGGNHVILEDSEIQQTSGDEAGSIGGVKSGVTKGAAKFTKASGSVLIHNKGVVRMLDTTTQNDENATGFVLGGEPTILVGD